MLDTQNLTSHQEEDDESIAIRSSDPQPCMVCKKEIAQIKIHPCLHKVICIKCEKTLKDALCAAFVFM